MGWGGAALTAQWKPSSLPAGSSPGWLGTSFSAASVIPAGDLHFVSTAQGHVSKTQMLSQVPSTLEWFLSVLCARIWEVAVQSAVYPKLSELLFPACSS